MIGPCRRRETSLKALSSRANTRVFISFISPQVGTGLSINALDLTLSPTLKGHGSSQKSAAFCFWAVENGVIWGIGADICIPYPYPQVWCQGTNPCSKRACKGGRALDNLCLLCSCIIAVAFSRMLGSWRFPSPSNPDHSFKSWGTSLCWKRARREFSLLNRNPLTMSLGLTYCKKGLCFWYFIFSKL